MLSALINVWWNNLHQHLYIMVCTLVMFYLQRRRARRIFRYQRETVVVFTKYPIPGKSKTRLIPRLGDNGAALSQRLMTDHIVDRLLAYQRTHTDLSIDIHYAGGTESQINEWFGRRRDNASGSLTWNKQQGADLGSRMKNALMKHLAQGEDRVIIIGGDIPDIQDKDIEEAMKALRREDDIDMVLGRSTDGGYYMVGGNTNIMPHLGTLFDGMKWSTDSVFVEQKIKALRLGLRLHVLERILSDVDMPQDLPMMKSMLGLGQDDLLFPRWSIVIPTLNEGERITHTIDNVVNMCNDLSKIEIVVADGGSTDDTCQRVKTAATTSKVPISLIHSAKGRGTQQNTGAESSTGFYIMFLHADTKLPKNFEVKAELLLSKPGTCAGAFQLGFDVIHTKDKRESTSKIFYYQMRLIEWGVRWRVKLRELPYGDQVLFMTRLTFTSIGGFPDWQLLEDVNLIQKLQKKGTIDSVPGDPCITLARRWEKNGAIKIFFLNQFILLAYAFGVSPQRLAEWYYGKPKSD